MKPNDNPQSGSSASFSKKRSARQVAAQIKALSPLRPSLGIVLGSGFQAVASEMQIEVEVPFSNLPGFPALTVRGHAGKLLLGHLAKTPVLILSGRAHYYEGYSMAAITFPIRVLAEYGIRELVLTNAAGGINPRFRPGDLMLLKDHINFMPENPLRGELPGDRRAGHGVTRLHSAACFVDLTQAYDPALNQLLKRAAKKVNLRLHAGVYVAVSGPSYETPAEIRAFARLGADAIGMSTVTETLVARQYGLAVAAISCITNLAAGRGKTPLSHTEVLATGERMKKQVASLFRAFSERYGQATTPRSPQ